MVRILEQLCNSLTESHMMTGVEIWRLEDGWKEVVKVQIIIQMPSTEANGVCMRELERANRKEKVLRFW